VGLTAYTY